MINDVAVFGVVHQPEPAENMDPLSSQAVVANVLVRSSSCGKSPCFMGKY